MTLVAHDARQEAPDFAHLSPCTGNRTHRYPIRENLTLGKRPTESFSRIRPPKLAVNARTRCQENVRCPMRACVKPGYF